MGQEQSINKMPEQANERSRIQKDLFLAKYEQTDRLDAENDGCPRKYSSTPASSSNSSSSSKNFCMESPIVFGPKSKFLDMKEIKPSIQPSFEDHGDLEPVYADFTPADPVVAKFSRAFALVDTDQDGLISCEQLIDFLFIEESNDDHVETSHTESQNKVHYRRYLEPRFRYKPNQTWTFVDFCHFMSQKMRN